ncbi:MAG: TonB-dependent receptor, partial [Candidatus Eremiobacteraeota bacterium]|nr:TonB-dependent receptor [Candidatus Eremiobacteraeota bacterium]
GYCFDATGTVITCNPAGDASGNRANFATWAGVANGTTPALAASCNIPGGASGPCTWLIAENSLWATYNTVTPKFTSGSLTDEFRPTDRLLFNLGLRFDQFQFVGADTRPNDPARAFWYRAWNLDNCVNASGAPVDKSALGLLPSDPCPSGFTNGNMQNISGTNTYDILQPRLGGTYTINPDTVVRFSAGKYAEPPNAAFQQYDTLEENTPFELGGSAAFYSFGFTSPANHAVRPPTSLNYDVSLEKRLKGTDVSYKVTPFLRKTKDQIQQFFLDQKTGFVSGLNVGRQTSQGVELQVNKGDFNHNGFAGQLSFAYTHSSIRYDALANGSTVVTGINADIAKYNALTQAGGGSACYLAGVASACTASGAVANPYYNAPQQPLIDPGQSFAPYTNFPGPLQSYAVSYATPYVATLIMNYKHNALAITPSLQFQAGARYGAPETTAGIDPTTCGAPLAGSISGDPRYPFGAAGGAPFDATNCGGTVTIPNPYTGHFDNIGSFVQPNQLAGNVQVSYDVSPKIKLVATLANVVNTCWGGTKAAWTVDNNNICSYNILNNGGGFGPVGNLYNPPATVADFQRLLRYPYGAYFGAVNVNTAAGNFNQTKQPFQFFLEARLKL